jgi:L-threonylcarbamoyladenylate synthase
VTLTARDAEWLEECLAGDGVAVIPTDTVYGLACNPNSAVALRRVYELKRRAPLKPTAVMFFALEQTLATLTELTRRERAAVEVLLPGPVTLLLPNPQRRFPLACEPAVELEGAEPAEVPPLGLRVPRLDGPHASLAGMRTPVLQSSANRSGEPAPRRLADVPTALRQGADLVLDGGELPGVASTVIDLSDYERSGEWRIVRDGPLDAATLRAALGGSC